MRAAKPWPHHLWARCPVGWCLSQSPALCHRQKNHGEKQLSQAPSSFPKLPAAFPSSQQSSPTQQIPGEQLQHWRLPQGPSSPLRESPRETIFQNRFKASEQQHTRPESPPHFPFCGPTAKGSQPLQRAGEMRTSTCEPQPEQNELLFLIWPIISQYLVLPGVLYQRHIPGSAATRGCTVPCCRNQGRRDPGSSSSPQISSPPRPPGPGEGRAPSLHTHPKEKHRVIVVIVPQTPRPKV